MSLLSLLLFFSISKYQKINSNFLEKVKVIYNLKSQKKPINELEDIMYLILDWRIF